MFILECTIFNYSPTIPLCDHYRGKKDTKASIRLSRDGKELDFTVVRKPFRLKGDRLGGKLFEKCALFYIC
jgi:C-terminal processing protease CtpA/Prc